jgi:murein L,D-transpeptidase YafK
MGAVKVREGDKRTPIGVYTITELLPKEKLTDFYGPIALPIDYPNAWDKRLGKTGYGIWLHGMPKHYVSRPPKASDGCVVLANQDLLALKRFVDIGNTQVVISERLDFVPVDVWKSHRKAALRMVDTWKKDLEKGFSKGIYHYASDVKIDGQGLVEWQQNKQIGNKSFGKITIEDLMVMRYPSDKDMMLISFKQEDKLSGEVRKQQYWMKVGTRWQIVQEDSYKL